MHPAKTFNNSRANFSNQNLDQKDYLESFDDNEVLSILGSAGLKSGTSLWYRLGAPIGKSNFLKCMAIKPVGVDHRRPGWMMGLVYLAGVMTQKGSYKMSAKLQSAAGELAKFLGEFKACIFEKMENRTTLAAYKFGVSEKVYVPNNLVNSELKQWLVVEWPQTFVETGEMKTRAALNQQSSMNPMAAQVPIMFSQNFPTSGTIVNIPNTQQNAPQGTASMLLTSI